MPEVTLVEAVNLALARAMQEDPNVVVLGEDVGVNGGVFRATAGLRDRFGPEYDRAVTEFGDRGRAESELAYREQRVRRGGAP